MEHQHLIPGLGERLPAGVHTLGRIAKHRRGDNRTITRGADILVGGADILVRHSFHHPANRPRRSRINNPRDPIDPRHIDNGWKQHHILRPHIRRSIPAGHRAHANLGHAKWKPPHRRRHNRRPRASTHPDDAVKLALLKQPLHHHLGPSRHHRHRLSPILLLSQRFQFASTCSRHLLRLYINWKYLRRPHHPRIHRHHSLPPGDNLASQKCILLPFGIERPNHQNRSHRPIVPRLLILASAPCPCSLSDLGVLSGQKKLVALVDIPITGGAHRQTQTAPPPRPSPWALPRSISPAGRPPPRSNHPAQTSDSILCSPPGSFRLHNCASKAAPHWHPPAEMSSSN